MRCPHCQTINRDDRSNCYHCGKDLVMLRLIINKAKQHYNDAIQKVQEEQLQEALGDLNAALELDSKLAEAHVLRGTILARLDRFDEAREAWERAIALDPETARAYKFVGQVTDIRSATPVARRARLALAISAVVVAVSLIGAGGVMAVTRDPEARQFHAAWIALEQGDLSSTQDLARGLRSPQRRESVETALRAELAGRLAEATRLARAGEERAALARLRDLAAVSLGPDLREAVGGEISHIRNRFFERLDAWNAEARLTVDGLRSAHATAREVRQLFPTHAPDVELAMERLAVRLQRQVDSELAPVISLLGDSGNAHHIDALFHLYTDFSASTDHEVAAIFGRTRFEEFQGRWATALVDWARDAAANGRRLEWSRHVARLEQWGTPPASYLDALAFEPLLVEHERTTALAALDRALAAESPDLIQRAALHAESVGAILAPSQTEGIARARQALATTAYYRLMEWADKIESLAISPEEAREVRRLTRQAEGPLPPRLRTRASENVLFFGIQAARALGDDDTAVVEFDALRAKHPTSPYLLLLERQGYSPHG